MIENVSIGPLRLRSEPRPLAGGVVEGQKRGRRPSRTSCALQRAVERLLAPPDIEEGPRGDGQGQGHARVSGLPQISMASSVAIRHLMDVRIWLSGFHDTSAHVSKTSFVFGSAGASSLLAMANTIVPSRSTQTRSTPLARATSMIRARSLFLNLQAPLTPRLFRIVSSLETLGQFTAAIDHFHSPPLGLVASILPPSIYA